MSKRRNSDMKILLLGAGGFIGANLCERLVKDGFHEITSVDIDDEKLDGARQVSDFRYENLDIREADDRLEELTKEHDALSI